MKLGSKEKSNKSNINININNLNFKPHSELMTSTGFMCQNEIKLIKEISQRQQNKLVSTLRIFDEIKKRVNKIKIDEKRLFEKSKIDEMDNLFKLVKDELVDFSLIIKEADFKLDIFLKKIFKNFKQVSTSPFNMISTPNSLSKNINFNKSKEEVQFNDIVHDLRNKNDELVSEMMDLKEKFVEAKIKNIDLKNRLKVKSENDENLHINKDVKEKSKSKNEIRNSRIIKIEANTTEERQNESNTSLKFLR